MSLGKIRLEAAESMGMGDCRGKDSPKMMLIFEDMKKRPATLIIRYWVNPERSEVHPTIAMTAAQALGAACLVPTSIAALKANLSEVHREEGQSVTVVLNCIHEMGSFPITIGISGEHGEGPDFAQYTSSVKPIASGNAYIA